MSALAILGMWLSRSNLRRIFKFEMAGDSSAAFIYLAASLVLVTWIYVKSLDGPSSFIPLFDNAHTLSMIQSFAKTDCYGPLLSSAYLDTPQLFQGFSYYPAVLHSISALAANMFGCGATEALNILVFDLLFMVLPLSVRSLIKSAFPGNKSAELFGVFSPFVFLCLPMELVDIRSVANVFDGFVFGFCRAVCFYFSGRQTQSSP